MTVRISTLANGMRVVSDHVPHLETTSVGVWVNVGTRSETAANNGVSHMLEHMAFKGTKRRDARRIAEEIEAVGGHLNAYTSREQTAYFARVMKEDVPLAVDMLADILQHSVFDKAELEREREVVVQEIGQTNDTPDDLVFDHFQAAAYPDQPMGWSILGTAERVRNFRRDDLFAYMAAHYRGPAMVLSAAGHVDHDTLVELAEAGFGDLVSGEVESGPPARYVGGPVLEPRPLDQIHFVLGFDGVSFADDEYFAAQVMATVAGGGMSSRLFQEVRERRGLAYSVYAFATSYVDGGLFTVYAGTGEREIGELVPVVCDELVKVGHDAEEDEIARARAQLKSSTLMSLESSSSRCEQLARQLLVYGRVIDIPEIIAGVEAVDVAAVRRVAKRLVGGSAPTVAAIGPIDDLEKYQHMAARFS